MENALTAKPHLGLQRRFGPLSKPLKRITGLNQGQATCHDNRGGAESAGRRVPRIGSPLHSVEFLSFFLDVADSEEAIRAFDWNRQKLFVGGFISAQNGSSSFSSDGSCRGLFHLPRLGIERFRTGILPSSPRVEPPWIPKVSTHRWRRASP